MEELFTEIQNAANVIAVPNWADKLSALAASCAVMVAVILALRQNKILKQQNEIAIKQAEIAEKQNKIALFEKKYEMYQKILFWNHFALLIAMQAITSDDIYVIFLIAKNKQDIKETEINKESLRLEMLEGVNLLDQVKFLFSQDIIEYSLYMSSELVLMLTNCLILKVDYLKDAKKSLNEILKKYENDKIDEKFMSELCLK